MSSLDSDVTGDPDSPIRVVVTPSQSAYFAGETLSVTITFTNTLTRTPEGEAGPSSKVTPRSARTHKRASHSVSSAPIARPPTSPAGVYKPKTPTTSIPGSPTTRQDSLALASDGTPLQRRRLIGRKVGSVPDLVEQRRKKMLAKSLSLTIGLHEGQEGTEDRLNGEEKQIVKSASYAQRSFTADAHLLPPSSPRVSSPLARSETLPLPSKHPHARKQSVTDGTHFPYPPPPTINGSDISTSPTSPTSTASTTSTSNTLAFVSSHTSGPPTPSASTSSYSLSLDPIAEVSPVVPAYPYLSPSAPASASRIGPALSSPSIAIEAPSPPSAPPSAPTEQPMFPRSKTRQTHRPPNIGLGKPSSHMFLDLTKSQAELILYSYAQLKGTVTLTPIPSNTISSSSSTKSVTSPRTPVQPVSSPYAPSPHLSPLPPLPLSAPQIEQQKTLNLASLRQALLKGSATAVGGGSMDITSRTHSRTPSAGGAASLGGGLGSGSWGSFGGGSPGPSVVPAYGPPSAKFSLGTIHSGSTDGTDLPLSARRPHSRASSLSSGFLSIFGSPFGLGGDSPMSAPAMTHPNNIAASVSAPNVSVYGQQRPNRNRTASAGVVPSSSSGWPSASSPSLIHSGPASAGLGSFTSFSALSSPGIGGPASGTRLGLGLGWPLTSSAEEVDPELPLPTFEAQSTMLAVDISLEPGESRSYDYSILLPSNLPPTFHGRTFRFAYELVVGICRAGTTNNFSMSGRSVGPAGSVSKVMKVPIRVYTNVVVGRPPIPYDLLWPVNKRRPTPVLGHRRAGKPSSGRGTSDNDDPYAGKVVELTPGTVKKVLQSKHDLRITASDSTSSLSGSINDSGSLMELKDYAKRLVAELPESTAEAGLSSSVPASDVPSTFNSNDGRNGIPSKPLSPLFEEDFVDEVEKRKVNGNSSGGTTTAELAFKEKERVAKMRQREESNDPILVGGCGEAVEILTRNPKKVSYDVNKDGVKVAVLTFIKSAFRLGETIQGVVELNERQGRARVVQLSAHLETHESLPYSISTTPNTATATRQLKRVHVEHHSSFVLSTLRTTFALDIPSDASPAFQLRVGDESFPNSVSDDKNHKLEGGLEWKVRLCLLVAVAKETADVGTEGVKLKSLVRDGPRGEWGSAWKAPPSAAPCEKPPTAQRPSKYPGEQQQNPGVVKSWTSFIAASILGTAEDGDDLPEDHVDEEGGDSSNLYDGIKSNRAGGVGIGVDFSGGKEGLWQEVKLETVECEVPVRVWPGNTAFKPVDVVFDV